MTWRDLAACRGHDPNLWHPVTWRYVSADTRQALAICAECPVAEQCDQHARHNSEQWGIWAGVLPWDRIKSSAPGHCRICDGPLPPPRPNGRSRRYCDRTECQRARRAEHNRRWRARRREAS